MNEYPGPERHEQNEDDQVVAVQYVVLLRCGCHDQAVCKCVVDGMPRGAELARSKYETSLMVSVLSLWRFPSQTD